MVGTREAADSLVDTAAIRVHLTDRLHAAGLRILPRHDIKRFYYLTPSFDFAVWAKSLSIDSVQYYAFAYLWDRIRVPRRPPLIPMRWVWYRETQWDTIARRALDSTVQAKAESLTTAFLRAYREAKVTP